MIQCLVIKEETIAISLIQELVHTSADLKKTADHTDVWQEIKQKNVERIIPESMYAFLSLHFEGMGILETSWKL